MKKTGLLLSTFLIFLTTAAFPAFAGWDPREKEPAKEKASGNRAVDQAITSLKKKDPGLKIFFEKAYGYAVFPTVGKAGIGLGGAYGEGEVFRKGSFIGSTKLTQITIGFQLGGQSYTEIIFFKDKQALEQFTSGSFEFNAQASAIAVTAGVSADADYDNGVAIFTLPKQGLMYEASIGGQKFSFEAAP